MNSPKNYDFCGWVTKNDILCSDGRTIRQDAFAHQDGQKVPMVWMHNHSSPDGVIGYTILENRPEGVFGYSYCNDTENGRHALEMVKHGDIDSYSIYANRLKERAADVVHGFIREVSLVLTGANDGARIVDVNLAHGDSFASDEAIIITGDSDMELFHGENEDAGLDAIIDTLNEDQLAAFAYCVAAARDAAYEEAGYTESDEDYDSYDEEDDYEEYDDSYDEEYDDEYDEDAEYAEMSHSDYEGDTDMYNNIFDNETYNEGGCLTHSDMAHIISVANSNHGSLKESYLAFCEDAGLSHADSGISYSSDVQAYGVNDPSFLFPDYHNLNTTPDWIKRDMEWVSTFMSGTKHVPFARIKSQFADITADEARAKGYIKGNEKVEEVFTLLKRTTDPQTIYKKQKFDRDDIIDITDFDVIAWIKGEMRMMLNEEIARAALVGDGRSSASNDKIQETHIRPIWGDDPLFTIYKTVATGATPDVLAKNMITTAIRARVDYKGSGNPVLFTTEAQLTEMLLLEDSMGRALYKTEQELATKMRVSKIVTVPVMENLAAKNGKIAVGIILNLGDYVFGADKGGAVELFDDFDIDFNQFKYLIETRCSGALTKPKSAIALEIAATQTTEENT